MIDSGTPSGRLTALDAPAEPLGDLNGALLRQQNNELQRQLDELLRQHDELLRQHGELQQQHGELQQQHGELQQQNRLLLENLRATERVVAELKRKILGRTSERSPKTPRKSNPRKKNDPKAQKKRRARKAKRAELPNREVPHPLPEDLSCGCPKCGGPPPTPLEPERSNEFEWIPGHLERREHVRARAVCPKCSTFFVAPAPTRVVDGGQYGPGLVSRVVVHKLLDSIPLYRQSKIFAREGLHVGRSTLVDLFHRAASLIEPVYERMLTLIPTSDVVYADETSLKMQRVKKLAYIWVFATSLYIAYVFSPSRSGKTATRVLGDSSGVLVVDGYTGYNHVTTPEGWIRAGCNAHARRKFTFIDDDDAQRMIDYFGVVFAVEREAAEREILGTPEHLELRKSRAGPAMEAIKAWCDKHVDEHGPKTPLGSAIRYVRNQWKFLTRFLHDVRIAPDNNLSERLLRSIALGRKNWLFVGHEKAGRNTAMLMSVLVTCVLHDVNPQEYLADVLLRVQDHPVADLDDLLPHRWKELFGGSDGDAHTAEIDRAA